MNEFDGIQATVEATVEQLQSAQEVMHNMEEPVEFEGKFVIENRPGSILSDTKDLAYFERVAQDIDFEMLYSFDLATPHGSEFQTVDLNEDQFVKHK